MHFTDEDFKTIAHANDEKHLHNMEEEKDIKVPDFFILFVELFLSLISNFTMDSHQKYSISKEGQSQIQKSKINF